MPIFKHLNDFSIAAKTFGSAEDTGTLDQAEVAKEEYLRTFDKLYKSILELSTERNIQQSLARYLSDLHETYLEEIVSLKAELANLQYKANVKESKHGNTTSQEDI